MQKLTLKLMLWLLLDHSHSCDYVLTKGVDKLPPHIMHIFDFFDTPLSSVSIADFEQVNVS